MDFIEQETECSDLSDGFTTHEQDNDDLESFIDNQEYEVEVPPFTNVERPIDGDAQSRLYDRESVDGRDIDNFDKGKFKAEKFRKTLLCFSESEESNLFFSAAIYGIFYLNSQNRPVPDFTIACNAINKEKIEKLSDIKQDIMLDYTQFGFWEKCFKLNEVLADHFGLFLRFYEHRNKYRYLLRKMVDSKNKIHSEVSSCAIPQFDGYEYLRHVLKTQEKKNLRSIDIVYELKTLVNPFAVTLLPKSIWHFLLTLLDERQRLELIVPLNNVSILPKLFFENRGENGKTRKVLCWSGQLFAGF